MGKSSNGRCVYKAKLKGKPDSPFFALKQLKMSKEEEGFPITALREIKILKKLSHTNVVNLYDTVVSTPHDRN